MINKLKFLKNRNTPKKFMLKYFKAKLAKQDKPLEFWSNVRLAAAHLTADNQASGLVSPLAVSSR